MFRPLHLPTLGLVAALTLCAAGPARSLPLISELLYDAVGSDDGLSFVELYGAPGTSLTGLFLEGVNGANGQAGPTVALSGVIPADGLFVVADGTSGGGTSVLGADLVANFDFQNGPDSVVLRDASSVIDAVGYGVFGAGEVFAGEGAAAPDPPAGSSLARAFADLDTDDNAADFAVLATPTPGSAPVSVPEPAGGLLALAGLAGLAAAPGALRRAP